MKIIYLDQIDSTQDYLKNLLESQPNEHEVLVITKNQTQGRGRFSHKWDFIPGSLACSFTLLPHKVFTLTSLEIAVIISDYLKKELKHEIELKWPNDLFYSNKKCGGIIISVCHNRLVVGLGINHHNPDFLKENMSGIDLKDNVAKDLVEYIHQNRIEESQDIIHRWEEICIHKNTHVTIDGEKGLFKGLGPCGEAIVLSNSIEKKYMSGSLRFVF